MSTSAKSKRKGATNSEEQSKKLSKGKHDRDLAHAKKRMGKPPSRPKSPCSNQESSADNAVTCSIEDKQNTVIILPKLLHSLLEASGNATMNQNCSTPTPTTAIATPVSPSAHQIVAPNFYKFEAFSQHFHLPLKVAAEKFGVRATAFKKRCRAIGIRHWPYRKVRSLKRSLQELRKLKMEEGGHLNERQSLQFSKFEKQLKKLLSPETYGVDPSGDLKQFQKLDSNDNFGSSALKLSRRRVATLLKNADLQYDIDDSEENSIDSEEYYVGNFNTLPSQYGCESNEELLLASHEAASGWNLNIISSESNASELFRDYGILPINGHDEFPTHDLLLDSSTIQPDHDGIPLEAYNPLFNGFTNDYGMEIGELSGDVSDNGFDDEEVTNASKCDSISSEKTSPKVKHSRQTKSKSVIV